MKVPAKKSARITSAGAVALTAVVVAVVALSALAAEARAASQPLLPFRCFAQVGVDHVVFGPESFFLPNTIQGPTSFSENALALVTLVSAPSPRTNDGWEGSIAVITTKRRGKTRT